jgi:hypothetical protein
LRGKSIRRAFANAACFAAAFGQILFRIAREACLLASFFNAGKNPDRGFRGGPAISRQSWLLIPRGRTIWGEQHCRHRTRSTQLAD